MTETSVLITGGGPAGLSLATALGQRGIACILVERRIDADPHPRASLLGARSMEYFRRHGFADDILNAGMPTRHRYEARFVTSLTGHLLHAYSTPSPDEYRQMHENLIPSSPDSAWSPYFKVQIGQHTIEPIIRKHLRSLPSVTCRYGWELSSFEQAADHVSLTITELATGKQEKIRADYLAACDGGKGLVRQQLGIPYVGRGAIGINRSFLFQSPKLLDAATTGRANLHFILNREVYGVIIDLDGRGLYSYSYFAPSEDRRKVAPADIIRKAMGRDFEFEVLRTMDWAHHQSVADSYRSGRVFLLGDAAHLFCPSGGIGMNTAIADAFDLGWKLAARVQGWGGEMLLDSYELERRPIAFRNTLASADNRDRIDSIMHTLPDAVSETGPEGESARARLKPRLLWMTKQFNTMGLHLGGRYAESPIVVPDGTPEPPDDPRIVTQSSWPGCRAPHAWLSKGHSTLDEYDGTAFVLVQCGTSTSDTAPFSTAATRLGVPLRHAHFSDPAIAALYQRQYVLVRPDGHVCWRSNQLPPEAEAILRTVSGRGA